MSSGRRIRRCGWVLVALPALLAVQVCTAELHYRCRYDGVWRKACCCPKHRDGASDAPTASANCCCDVERIAVARVPIRAGAESDQAAAPPLQAVWPPTVEGPRLVPVARLVATTWPRAGPPTFLLKNSLLL